MTRTVKQSIYFYVYISYNKNISYIVTVTLKLAARGRGRAHQECDGGAGTRGHHAIKPCTRQKKSRILPHKTLGLNPLKPKSDPKGSLGVYVGYCICIFWLFFSFLSMVLGCGDRPVSNRAEGHGWNGEMRKERSFIQEISNLTLVSKRSIYKNEEFKSPSQ